MEFFNTEREMLEIIFEATKGVAFEEFKAKAFEDEEFISKKTKSHRRPTNKGERRKTEIEHRFKRAKLQLQGLEASIDEGARGISYLPWGSTDGRTVITGADLAKRAKWVENYYDPTSLLRKKASDGAKLHDAFNGTMDECVPSFQNNECWEEDFWSAYERLKKAEKTLKEVEERLDDIQVKMTSKVTMTLEEAYEAYSDLMEERAIVRGDYYVALDERDSALQRYQLVYDKYI